MDSRWKYLKARLLEMFLAAPQPKADVVNESRLRQVIEESLATESENGQLVSQWMQGSPAPPHLIVYFTDGDRLVVTTSKALAVKERAVWLHRNSLGDGAKAVSTRENDLVNEIIVQPIDGCPLMHDELLLREVYLPLFKKQKEWGTNGSGVQQAFLKQCYNYHEVLEHHLDSDLVGKIGSVQLRMPEEELLARIPQGSLGYQKAAADGKLVGRFEECLEQWMAVCRGVLEERPDYASQTPENIPEEKGPLDELQWWKDRLSKFLSITEQLNRPTTQIVQHVLTAAKSGLIQDWQAVDVALTDGINETKENVKYLVSLEKYIEPLYTGPPSVIMTILPSLMNHLRLMYAISRYYSDTGDADQDGEPRKERMTRLLCLVTNRMIVTCKDSIKENGKLWDQTENPEDLRQLIAKLEACRELKESYKTEYERAQKKLEQRPLSPQFDFAYRHVFGRIDLFCRRVDKLIEIFQTIDQFKSLSQYNIDEMEPLIVRFNETVETLKKNTCGTSAGGDLLDYTRPSFDKEYNEFGKHIAELESSLQVFINSRFENITSTENALALLKKFQIILHQPHLKQDLESKHMVIFHNYGLDLEHMQKMFERHKASPPIVRNMTNVAGCIIWARQLLRRIEGPMRSFQNTSFIMSTQKESKKIVRTYNKVARWLVEYEQLWLAAWQKHIDVARQGLNATLIVRHEGRLYVNFDIEILSLIKEVRAMMAIGPPRIPIPQAAKMTLMQEKRYKSFCNELTYALKEHERVVSKIIPITKSIMSRLLAELDDVIQPGETSLTWASMNIDRYIQRLHEAIGKLDTVVSKVNDIITNRIQSSLKRVTSTLLVHLPEDVCFTLDQFVSLQERHIQTQSELMEIKNKEVEQAADDVISTILHYQSDGGSVPEEEIIGLKNHFNRLMFKVILGTTTKSLNLIKRRVGTRHRGVGFMFVDKPFFDVQVELAPPHVILHPSLEEVQKAINKTATAVLACSKNISPWSGLPASPGGFFQEIAKNKEIVKDVLLLTGGIHGLKKQVLDYLNSFKRYEYLWTLDMAEEYQKFLATEPTLAAFEAELRKYLSVEKEVDGISPTHTIGSLSLETKNLRKSLKQLAREWRNLYAKNLHLTAQKELDHLMGEIDDWNKMLSQDLTDDLEGLKAMMETLTTVRTKESEIELRFKPVEEMYELLRRPEYNMASVTQEESERVGELRFHWKKLRGICERRNDQISQLQHGYKRDLTQAVQRFSVDVIVFRNDYDTNGPMVKGISPEEAMNRLKKYTRLFEDKYRKWQTLVAGESLFGLPLHRYPELAKTSRELSHLEKLYSLYVNVRQRIKGYEDILWGDLVKSKGFQQIEEECKVFALQCKNLPRGLKQWEAYKELERTIADFGMLRPLLSSLANEYVKPRHWYELMEVTKTTWRLDPDVFKLGNILEANIIQHAEVVDEIALKAEKEAQVEMLIRTKIEEEWADKCFAFEEWRGRGLLLLKGDVIMEIKESLEESQMLVGGLNPRFVEPFKETVKLWMQKLVSADKTINLWLEVQQNWQALEAVFSGGDITKQLPNEAKKFNQIDKQWFKIMTKALEVKNVISFCYENELLAGLGPMRDGLENVQRQLSAYLETKKKCFPRFYFVADKELLDILSQASDPTAIQQYVKKLFDGVSQVHFYRAKPKEAGSKPDILVTHLGSPEGEELPLVDSVHCKGHVEEWLHVLVRQMHYTVKARVAQIASEIGSLRRSELPYFDQGYMQILIDRYPAQCVLLAVQMLWTMDVTEYITAAKMERAQKAKELGREDRPKEGRLNALLDFLIHKTRDASLNSMQRTNIETLITIHVHQLEIWWRTILANKNQIRDKNAFEWLKQVRFYFIPDKEAALVSICDTDKEYCNEYLGVKERLVITPLTDRCYITLSQALAMKMGGAPAGPAGTGKTETTKDLGRTYGIYVVVFNCSDQMDRNAMGKIVKGLAQANAWGCFDEFNRIELPVLSVVAQQIECVLKALKEHRQEFRFIDDQVWPLKSGVGYFITMNPGYAGRQELPENLKILFRGVTMMVPERKNIIKVKLASAGYTEKDVLSEKFYQLYQLCEQQLSKQRHYDFGLRNILSVLRSSGARLRAAMDGQKGREGRDFEEYLFMRTLLDMNMSKLVYADVGLFRDLLRDIFPGKEPEGKPDLALNSALTETWGQLGLLPHPQLMEKVSQLHETMKVRHGIMVVGPAMCGKSSTYEGLRRSLAKMKGRVGMVRMFPKAVTAQEMFGRLDKATGDWHDGIFSHLWKKAVTVKNAIWIVCDGPVDAIWIENLNTVLDDNKLLTLAGGDRIPMTDHMKLCFEVENLRNASPATVSRAGIIYISENELGWEPVIRAKLFARESQEKAGIIPADVHQTIPRSLAEQAVELYCGKVRNRESDVDESNIERVWRIYTKDCEEVMQTSLVHLVVNSFTLMVALVAEGQSLGRDASSWPLSLTEKVFWFCVAWAFGGMLEQADRVGMRQRFDSRIRTITNALPECPEGETVFEYRVDLVNDRWVHWNTEVEEWSYPGDDQLDFSSLFIHTLDSSRLNYLLKCFFTQHRPVLFMGGSGTAKTVTIENFLNNMHRNPDFPNRELLTYKKVNFSFATTPRLFYETVEEIIEKRVGSRAYGPKRDKRLVLFIDDLNMPEINQWGDQVTNEIVRQVIDDKGYYSLDKDSEFKYFVDMLYMAAMSKPGGGKNDIPDRLKRHFATICIPLPTDNSLRQIYEVIFKNRFEQPEYTDRVRWVAGKLTELSIDMWKSTAAKMLPTPRKFHYFFNLRDLTNITQGVMKCGKAVFCGASSGAHRIEAPPDPEVLLVRLWKHEATRVFSDKLNDLEDTAWFERTVNEKLAKHLNENPWGDDLTARIPQTSYFVEFMQGQEIDPDTGNEVELSRPLYQPAQSMAHLKAKLHSALQMYNATEGKVKKLGLVLFDAAVDHVVRITRVITMPRGNMLLVGVGGSGKQSLTRLSSFLVDHHLHQITVSKQYGVPQLFDEVREQYRVAGLRKPVTFLMTDNEIKQEKFLEYINNFLSSGEIPGLWERDPAEKDDIISASLALAKRELSAKCEQTPDFLWKYFIARVRANLHFVLCFSPVGDKFRQRARQFPSIISTCTIDWFFPWPNEALREVAKSQLDTFPVDCGSDRNVEQKVRGQLLQLMARYHEALIVESTEYFSRFRRQVFSTPKSYLSFLHSYRSVYTNKHRSIKEGAMKIERGLNKLDEAGKMIREMKSDMEEQERKLSLRRKEIEVQLVEVKEATQQAAMKQAEVSGVKDELAKDAQKVQEKKDDANKDLEAALPALEEAREAANEITPSDLKELQASANNPAHLTRVVIDGVLILLHNAVIHPVSCAELKKGGRLMGKGNGFIAPSWDLKSADAKFIAPPYGGGGKRFISNSDCVKTILDFTEKRKDQINEETCELLDPYLDLAEFNYDDAWSTSHALGGLCKWVRSMYNYIKIARVVEPKMVRLREMEMQLHAAQSKLKDKELELAAVNAEKQKQSDALREKELEMARMEQKAAETARRMHKANGLIDDLSGERERWTEESEANKDTIRRLVGDVALCCAFISYCGPYNSEFRNHVLQDVLFKLCKQFKVPVSESIGNGKDVVRFLVDEQQITDWQLEGLPTDEHSVQNAIMVTQSLHRDPPKYSLLIDPQGQGLVWLRNAKFPPKNDEDIVDEEEDGIPAVVVTQLTDRNLRKHLQDQMEAGKTLIIENVGEELDPMLDPVLEHCVARGRKPYIPIQSETGSDTRLDYHPGFRIFFTTKLPNPNFAPELFAKVTVIDFTVTMMGLEQQLLSDIIGKEKNELEEERKRLIQNMNDNKKMLSALEDRLLTQLSTSNTNLIDDEDLVSTLAENKKKAAELTEKQSVSIETRRRIDAASLEYLPVAKRGSVLYFLIVELSNVNPMYQTSLVQFRGLFDRSIREAEHSQVTANRIEAIVSEMTKIVFTYIDCGLFAKHKLLFVLLLACKILQRDGHLSPQAFQVLLKGGAALNREEVKPKQVHWLPDKAWLNVMAASMELSHNRVFRLLPDIMSRAESQWRLWYDLEAPEAVPPPELEERLDAFDRLLVVRCIREDRLMLSARSFVIDTLGPFFAESPQLRLDNLVDTTDPLTPIIFLLSPGSDPTQMISGLGRKRRKMVRDVSMGEGQEAQAMAIVQHHAFPNGDWALLQNCHLSIDFLNSLEEELIAREGDRGTDRLHPDARIWITAEPSNRFPIGLLQMSIKLTNEPPAGIRAGLKRTFAAGSQGITQEMIEAFRRPEWRPVIFAQAFLHSLVQERRKFGPIGFCVPYEFNSGDLTASLMFLTNHFTQIGDEIRKEKAGAQVSWETIRYMVAKIQYGGRITDNKDAFLFEVIAQHILKPEIVSDSFNFDKGYPLPVFDEIVRYREFIDEVYPDVDPPEVFGLHANADIVYRNKMANEVLQTVISIQPKQGAVSHGVSREEVVDREAKKLLRTLPAVWKADMIQECAARLGRVHQSNSSLFTPLTIFCTQEVERLSTCVSLVRRTLTDLQLAIAGTIVMSTDLQDALDNLFDARVPAKWLAVSWKATVLGPWYHQLQKRFDQLDRWLRDDRPSKFWITGFYNPQGFLTCVSQEVTRSHATDREPWSLEEVCMRSEVTRLEEAEVEKPPTEGVYIYGLYLDGAGWDRMKQRIRDPVPKAEPHRMPVIHITAEASRGKQRRQQQRGFHCPVYKYPERKDENWVFDCHLGVGEADNPNMWIRRGVCLLCAVD